MSDAAPTRLYLVAPLEIPEPEAFAELCGEVFAAADVACLRVALPPGLADREEARLFKALKAPCHAHDVALVVENRFDLVKPYGLDGVHLTGAAAKAMEEARSAVGKQAILGVDCGDSRHKALTAGEKDADYVAFGPIASVEADAALVDLVLWWQSMIETPCVAEIAPDPILAAKLWGVADFLAPDPSLWSAPEGPRARLKGLSG